MFVFERCIYKYYDIHILAHTNSCTLNNFPAIHTTTTQAHKHTHTHTGAYTSTSKNWFTVAAGKIRVSTRERTENVFFFREAKRASDTKLKANNTLSRRSALVMCMLLLMPQMVEFMPISMWRDVVLLSTKTHGTGECKKCFNYCVASSSSFLQGLQLCLCLCTVWVVGRYVASKWAAACARVREQFDVRCLAFASHIALFHAKHSHSTLAIYIDIVRWAFHRKHKTQRQHSITFTRQRCVDVKWTANRFDFVHFVSKFFVHLFFHFRNIHVIVPFISFQNGLNSQVIVFNYLVSLVSSRF